MKRNNNKALYENIMTAISKEVKKALNEKTAPTGVWVPDYCIKLNDTRPKDQFAPSYLPTEDLVKILGQLRQKASTGDIDKEILDRILNFSDNKFSREEYAYAINAAFEIISNLYHQFTKNINEKEIEYKR